MVATLFALVSVSYLGTVASFERAVYTSALDQILNEHRTESTVALPLFLSRPYKCRFQSTYVDRPTDPILEALNSANDHGTRPIPLIAASHIVPVMPWEDNLEVFNAGYLGISTAELGFVSRVGFDRFYTRAAVCITHSHAVHGYGRISILERNGLDWSVVSSRTSMLSL